MPAASCRRQAGDRPIAASASASAAPAFHAGPVDDGRRELFGRQPRRLAFSSTAAMTDDARGLIARNFRPTRPHRFARCRSAASARRDIEGARLRRQPVDPDEPTAVLTPPEVDELIGVIDGCAPPILSAPLLREAKAVSDRHCAASRPQHFHTTPPTPPVRPRHGRQGGSSAARQRRAQLRRGGARPDRVSMANASPPAARFGSRWRCGLASARHRRRRRHGPDRAFEAIAGLMPIQAGSTPRRPRRHAPAAAIVEAASASCEDASTAASA